MSWGWNALAVLLLAGCATPGPPEPGSPSLHEAGPPPRQVSLPEAPISAEPFEAGLAEAETLLAGGRSDEAEDRLRELTRLPGDPGMVARALLMRARIAESRGDRASALFLLKQALEHGPPSSTDYEIKMAIGDLRYEAGDVEGASRYYLEALQRTPPDRIPPERVWLRLAERAFYGLGDRDLARYYLLQAPGLASSGQEDELLARLLRRVSWLELGPSLLGVGDGNVSAVAADGDDLWVGTWNGGVVRYSLGSGSAAVFREGRASLTPNTVRSIEVTETRVWIGTYQGLFVFSKPSSTWSEVPEFGGPSPKRTEAIQAVGRELYVGTLGDGLWRLREGKWSKVSTGLLPGDFVNALAYADGHLLIGTLNLGIVVLDPASQAMWSFDRVNPGLEARNIILLLPVGTRELWIGTYGMGLYRWDRDANRLFHYDKATGQVGDDWVLSGAATSTGLYFGTFGAGVSGYRDGRWRRVGLRDGLAGLDVTAVAYAPPYVAFGTLGGGVSLFEESLALAGFPVIE